MSSLLISSTSLILTEVSGFPKWQPQMELGGTSTALFFTCRLLFGNLEILGCFNSVSGWLSFPLAHCPFTAALQWLSGVTVVLLPVLPLLLSLLLLHLPFTPGGPGCCWSGGAELGTLCALAGNGISWATRTCWDPVFFTSFNVYEKMPKKVPWILFSSSCTRYLLIC